VITDGEGMDEGYASYLTLTDEMVWQMNKEESLYFLSPKQGSSGFEDKEQET